MKVDLFTFSCILDSCLWQRAAKALSVLVNPMLLCGGQLLKSDCSEWFHCNCLLSKNVHFQWRAFPTIFLWDFYPKAIKMSVWVQESSVMKLQSLSGGSTEMRMLCDHVLPKFLHCPSMSQDMTCETDEEMICWCITSSQARQGSLFQLKNQSNWGHFLLFGWFCKIRSLSPSLILFMITWKYTLFSYFSP